ncbi:MAG: hypothetical protein E5W74_09185 [Mesorhizobium sp.]|uniref:hypothetical protein n=1 Tax=Mesorhizobium sp. TaxID=1871066 RepID=UPI0012095907|nr:hypothetical protein [Mesorhizobium sp.]TIT12574.1 MAG: hypothetical protein E5W74_09185 [Mesorhizobium sp.]
MARIKPSLGTLGDKFGRAAWDALQWMTEDEVRRWLRVQIRDWHSKLNQAVVQAEHWNDSINAMLIDVTDDRNECTVTFRFDGWWGEFEDRATAGTFLGALMKACNPDRLAQRLDEVALAREK